MNPSSAEYYQSLLDDKEAQIDALQEANDQLREEIADLTVELEELKKTKPMEDGE